MDKDIFAQVKHIEDEATALLEAARAERAQAIARARTEAAEYRADSKEKLETETRLLHEEHESALALKKDTLTKAFEDRKARLIGRAEARTDELADWLAGRFLEGPR
jgi:F0F1-type ATP synthase membrane subunit b/b'